MASDSPKVEALTALGSELPKSRLALEQEVVSLFDQCRDRLLRYIVASGLTIPEGEEVIQETFLSLFRHLRANKSRHNLPGWLFRVAHNLALKQLQRSRRRAGLLANADTWTRDVLDPSPSPEEQFANAQARQRLLSVVDALPERDRKCLLLRAEGLRYREIAAVLGISPAAVSLSLSRSLARLGRATQR